MTTDDIVIQQTRCWVKNVVVRFNFCPFAKKELDSDNLRLSVCQSVEFKDCLQALIDECLLLDQHPEINTSLLILATAATEFEDYLTLIDMSERLLIKQGYEGIYQLASFHPDYRFADSETDDPADYTNRSPYPMLHIIRESTMEQALKNYPQAESIPERNIQVARTQGKEKMQSILDSCKNPNDN